MMRASWTTSWVVPVFLGLFAGLGSTACATGVEGREPGASTTGEGVLVEESSTGLQTTSLSSTVSGAESGAGTGAPDGTTTADDATGSTSGSLTSSTGDQTVEPSTGGTTTGDTTNDDSTTGDSTALSIYELQDGSVPAGTIVDVADVVVSGVAQGGFFVQEASGGAHSGIYVHAGNGYTPLAVGDRVDLEAALLHEHDGLTELDVTAGAIVPLGTTLTLEPAELETSTFATPESAEPWEGVLVRVTGSFTVANLPGFNEFDVSDGEATLRIDNFLFNVFANPDTFPNFGVGAALSGVTGPVNFTFGSHKIAPRSAAELPGYIEPPNDGAVGVDALEPGDLVVTEVMYDPSCLEDACEWVEIYNATGSTVNLQGLRIQDSQLSTTAQGEIEADVVLEPHAYAVLAKGTGESWPYAFVPLAYYGTSPGFNNSGAGDFVVLRNGADVILDQTAGYTPTGTADNGRAWKLLPTALDAVSNDDAALWCFETSVFEAVAGVDEYGSPGAANSSECL